MSDTILYNLAIDQIRAFRKSSPYVLLITYDTLLDDMSCYIWDQHTMSWYLSWSIDRTNTLTEYEEYLHTVPYPDDLTIIVYAEHMNGSHS